MGGGSRHNVPILDYFAGKSMHKVYSRGVPIMPVFIGAPHPDAYLSSRRSSRASQPVEKPTRSRCEVHGDQSRPSTPCNSEKYCEACYPRGSDSESLRRKKTHQRSHAQKSTAPAGFTHPACGGWASSSSTSTKVANRQAHYHHCYPYPNNPGVNSCSQDHIHDYDHPAHPLGPCCGPHQPVETPTQSRYDCRTQPVPSPECDMRTHCCCGSDDCRSDNASFYTVDDSISECSVEALPGSQKTGNDSQDTQGGYHCYHPVYVAFPCGATSTE